ncbi:serine hydrolase domain-containing protein [Pseudalkalibacillus caeni]|uniref:Beta-lactamase family protein n=1 Tax=Exobacillus caeni TaxID=2574798 RepID=A0A5R9FCU6_9BACL|nr:serine hydrolase domain-containing protein [Pseudalkalibacillus caeni]TLS38693.1 beta-lactamase family protein [Pseudalkalibacillus caeni]
MSSLETKIYNIFKKYIDNSYMAGGVCSIKQNDQQILLEAYGKRNMVTCEDVRTDTIFDLASVTKTITSTLILKLITKNRLALDAKLGDCLLAAARNGVLAPITIQQLLTHTSGLVAWFPFYTELPTSDLYEILSSIELNHQEEKEVVYSDLNYILLGEILKHKHQASLQKIIEKELVQPLQLPYLTYGPLFDENIAATEFGNQIEMEMCRSRNKTFSSWRDTSKPIIGEVNDGNAHYFFQGQSGHAGLFGTAADLSKIAELYLKGGIVGGTEFLDPKLVKQSLQTIAEDRGLGWHSSNPFPVGFGHTGFTGTALWVVPEKNLQVVLLTNRLHVEEPVNINPFRQELYEEILNKLS